MTAREIHEQHAYESECAFDRRLDGLRFRVELEPLPLPEAPPVPAERQGPPMLTQLYRWWELDEIPERYRAAWWRETQALDRQ